MSGGFHSLATQRQLEARANQGQLALMRRAALAATRWVGERYAPGSRITVLAGPGNNGGDALHLACELAERGYTVCVVCPQAGQGDEVRTARARWDAHGKPTQATLPAARPALIVDGLFGIGLNRPLAAPWDRLIDAVNASGCPVLALDTPSGLDPMRGHCAGPAIRATHTLTFLCHKPGLLTGDGSGLAGLVQVETLALPPAWLPPPQGEVNLPAITALARRPNSHKGSYGTLCVAGGAEGMLGAALLAGRAALACGAGKVRLATLDTRLAVDPLHPELMIAPLTPPLAPHDVCVIGPGLGQSAAASAALADTLHTSVPLVIDADALNLIAADTTLAALLAERDTRAVLTPHPAEAARLLGCTTADVQQDRVVAAQTLARALRQVVVLKGAGSVIARPDGFYRVNASGNAALAAAGQGDVLSGCIGALLAQHLTVFDAACLGVYLHGLTGDLYRQHSGNLVGLTASQSAADLAPLINALLLLQQASHPHLSP